MRKGFTLVELLAVIAIIAILSLIVVPNVDNSIKINKTKLQKVQYEKIKKAAKNLLAENVFVTSNDNYEIYVSYIQLVEKGYIEYENKDPLKKDNYYNPYSFIKIVNTDGKITYDIPSFDLGITKNELDSLMYCTISDTINNSYSIAQIKCDGTVKNITPSNIVHGANNIYIYNISEGINLYQNIME